MIAETLKLVDFDHFKRLPRGSRLGTDDGRLERIGIKLSYAKLRGRIREKFMTQEAFAEAMGMNTVSLSQRLNGKLEWKSSEIAKACEVLEIPLSENAEYFFVKKVKIS